jgi:hypothetical protein
LRCRCCTNHDFSNRFFAVTERLKTSQFLSAPKPASALVVSEPIG